VLAKCARMHLVGALLQLSPGAGAQAAEICEALRSLDRSRLGWGLDFALQARPGVML
jgi:hypothetical protein